MHAVGILGGTFDPIHLGHLRMAQELAESLALSSVRFIPASVPAHRAKPNIADEHRVAMVRLATADNPLFQLDLREFERAGPSFMVDTLASLRDEVGPKTPLYLLLGADAYSGLPNWHCWQSLFDFAHIVVAQRRNVPFYRTEEHRNEQFKRYLHEPDGSAAGRILLRSNTLLDISASTIRKMIAQGRSVRYLLPESVNNYIQTHHLYEKEPHGT